MCGIAGIFYRDGRPIGRESLIRMARAIAHRGPDSEGMHVDDGCPSVGLAARRLAIIDVENGGQPMATEDERFTIVYNGEMFNADDVRRGLEGLGHRFRSRCDTEVVLRGYAQWGPEVVTHLNGMWAFAVWDRRTRGLFVSRDRLGVKPLVYADTPQGFAFASEIKALLASGLVGRNLDLTALPHYLSSFVVPEPYSFFRGVRRLPAGHNVLVNAGGAREHRYWDCGFEEEQDRGLDIYQSEVRELLADAVRRQLVSDVPLGVFLSAGVDSGVVAAVAGRAAGRLRTFTLGFEGSLADERQEARRLAVAIGAQHTEDVVTAREAASRLPDLLAAHDEPSQSLIQAYFVSRLAKREVTVALSGLGGDELFSSYPTHRVVDLLARLDEIPLALRRGILALAGKVGGKRARRLVALAEMRPDDRVSRWLLHQTDAATRELLISPDVRRAVDLGAPARHLEEHYTRTQARHPLNRLLYVYLKTYLPDELLRTLDSMSMAHSLEARVPLLDHRLVEYAMRMPARYKMSLTSGKVLLRRVAAEILPARSVAYRKRGFSPPIGTWLRRELSEVLRDTLCRPAVERRGVFDSDAVARLLESCLSGDTRSIQPVMMLFAFEMWAHRMFDSTAVSRDTAATPELRGVSPDLSVIIVNWNTRDILRDCLASVKTHLGTVCHETIVIDNASSDDSADMIAKEFQWVRLIRNVENVGFARANNQAMRVARGRWFFLLNSDTVLIDDSVAHLFARIQTETQLGVAHCRLVFPDRRLQHTTYRFPSIKLAILEDFGLYKMLPRAKRGKTLLAGYWEQDKEQDVDWVAGSFMLLRRQVFRETGGFSEAYFMYGEDMEWCYRIRDCGWRIRYYPQASVVHLDHGSSAIRWGDRRIAICAQRQVEIYTKRHGRFLGVLFNFEKTIGALFRFGYFSIRNMAGGQRDYYRNMKRYYLLCLRVYAALAVGRR
jgi:asparagine synthase (glutamine-hydrolysing)